MDQQGAKHGAAEAVLPATRTLMLIVAVLVVLTIVVIAIAIWKRYHSRPDCTRYSGAASLACMAASAACQRDGACLNAVAQCLPVGAAIANESTAAGKFAAIVKDVPQLASCSAAIAKVNPRILTSYLSKDPNGCINATMAAAVKPLSPAVAGLMFTRDVSAMSDVADAIAPAVPWAVAVAKGAQVCK